MTSYSPIVGLNSQDVPVRLLHAWGMNEAVARSDELQMGGIEGSMSTFTE